MLITTLSGGAGVLIADLCEQQGLEVPETAPDTLAKLKPISPELGSLGNPIDLTFETRQLLAIGLAALIVPVLVSDGESTWIEGLQLLALYAVIAIGFWY